MPRDGSNNYTLPEAPFTAGTTATASAVNANFSDIATALTDSFTRSETTTFTRTVLDDTDAATARTTLGVPARPNTTGSSTAGYWYLISPGSGNAAELPAGGTWAYFIFLVDSSGALTAVGGFAASVAAGGSTIGSAVVGYSWIGFAWRIA